jgi:pilus assembly protein CpaD
MWWSNPVVIRKIVSSSSSTSGPRLIFALALSALAAACASRPPEAALGPPAITPTLQYALVDRAVPDRIGLAIHAEGLSSNQEAALGDFVRRWRDGGGGPIEIAVPASGADPILARRMADAVSVYMTDLGAPTALVKLVGYDPSGAANPPVLATFSRLQPAAVDCSKTWNNLTSTGANRPSTHFGCTVTADMALQVADPHDLAAPRAADGSDDGRRLVVLDKYRQGQVTSSAKDSQASGQVSQ